jgi:hypothetical protein
MGFLTLSPDVSTLSPITPVGKDVQVKAFTVARTETASVNKVELPADASIIGVVRLGSTVSDAVTTATVTITASNNSGSISTKADDVKGSGATTGFVQMTALPNLEPRPLTGDIVITAVYAETGGASSTGGPWNYLVYFVR